MPRLVHLSAMIVPLRSCKAKTLREVSRTVQFSARRRRLLPDISSPPHRTHPAYDIHHLPPFQIFYAESNGHLVAQDRRNPEYDCTPL